jgi:hypothetical protein
VEVVEQVKVAHRAVAKAMAAVAAVDATV